VTPGVAGGADPKLTRSVVVCTCSSKVKAAAAAAAAAAPIQLPVKFKPARHEWQWYQIISMNKRGEN